MFLNQAGCSNRLVGLEEDEREIIRLKNLFEENMLKVEKENMEIIKKKISDTKLLEKKGNNTKRIIGSNTSVGITKSTVYKRLHRKLSDNKNESESQLPNLQTETVCHNTSPKCRSSAIHFLNHFQSSFISSKVQDRDCFSTENYMPCAVPLAPPTQKRCSVLDEMLQQNNIKTRSAPNVVLHHVISEKVPKKLTVQVLPSITIHGTKKNYCTKISNVLTEEIKKKDYFEGDGIKTTILPVISKEERNRISSIKLNSTNRSKIILSNEESQLSDVIQHKLSTFTQTSCETSRVPDWTTEKERLREIVKEILQDFPLRYQCDHIEINPDPASIKEQDVLSPQNDCELDSFLGNVDSSPRLSSNLIDEKVPKSSAHTQTSQDIPTLSFDKEHVKDLIQEVISKLQQNASCQLSFVNNEKIEKAHKEIQTNVKDLEALKDVRCFAPKAVQVSLREEPSVKCDSARAETFEKCEGGSTENFLGNTVHKLSEGELISKPLESSKLESILNCIYERFCVERVVTPQDPQPVTSSYRERASLVSTREVSVQINPVSSLTKGTCTSEVIRVDANQQCSLLSPVTLPEKHVSHASVQAESLIPEAVPIPRTTTSTCVQCEQPASIDSYAQTMEYLTVHPASENSANTSVSTTPVSDSMFLDDMLSEGEVYLPCNLRLLSGPDKTGVQNSRNDTDMSGNSDKDNDYSLSEGEIHPKYLQHINLHLSSSGDGHINNYSNTKPSYPQHSTVLLGRSPGEVNPESRSHSAAERSFYSSSSLSEGEVRSCTTPLSEGEIPFYARQGTTFRPSSSQSFFSSWSEAVQNPSFRYPFPSHRSEFSLESDPRPHYHLSASHDEPIRRVSDAPLRTVAEEK